MRSEVFAFYDCSEGAPPGQAAMVTIWARGWANRGWTPRLITARHARRSKFYAERKDKIGVADTPSVPLLALHAVGGGLLMPLNVMNFEFPVAPAQSAFDVFGCGGWRITRAVLEKFFKKGECCMAGIVGCARYGEARWLESPLVYFPDTNLVLDCGRPL